MVDPAGPFPYDLTPGDNVLKWTNYLKTDTMPTVDKIPVDATHKGISVPLGSLACMVLLLLCTFLVVRRRQKSQPVKVQLGLILVLLVGIVMLFPQFQISIGDSARASQISEDDSKVITLSLLENVYRSFDFRDEEDVYDKLAISVNGDLLTDIYLQSRKSLVIEQAGGAQAKIKQVAVLETEVQEADKNKGAVAIRTKWTATGSVGHWGHLHTRQNVYDAILTLSVADGFWKISGIELLEEKRLDSIK
jgi:hypothetical protein